MSPAHVPEEQDINLLFNKITALSMLCQEPDKLDEKDDLESELNIQRRIEQLSSNIAELRKAPAEVVHERELEEFKSHERIIELSSQTQSE